MAGIIDDSILHWSSQNDTPEVRTAVQLIMIPEEAQAIHYYRDEDRLPGKLPQPTTCTHFILKTIQLWPRERERRRLIKTG